MRSKAMMLFADQRGHNRRPLLDHVTPKKSNGEPKSDLQPQEVHFASSPRDFVSPAFPP